MINTFENDAITLAKAVVDLHSRYNDDANHLDLNGHECFYCQTGYFKTQDKIVHEIDCPVLIAKDLITQK
jgi:hypothetical protein